MAEPVYLDYAATTPLDPRVLAEMEPYLREQWGNPSSIYGHGRKARRALDDARDRCALVLGARANEIVFTAGGSESDNLALKGAAMAAAELRGWKHLVVSQIEHHAVLHAAEWLEKHLGYSVTYVAPDAEGLVSADAVARAVRPDTSVVSAMLANNEVGTIQPVRAIAQAVRAANPTTVVHTDAVQAAGLLPLDVTSLGVDLLSLSGHKVYGPKGVGLLYVKRGTPLLHLTSGGGQERGLRAGTENVSAIVGLMAALELAQAELATRVEQAARTRDALVEGVLSRVGGSRLTGHPTQRLPNNASFVFADADGESVLLNLDQAGICASSGSACTSGSLEVSHVLRAMGYGESEARGSLRLTTGTGTTDADVARVLDVLPGIVGRVRSVPPALLGGRP